MDLITARDLIVRCAGGTGSMGVKRSAQQAFVTLRRSKLFKTATPKEQLYLRHALCDELMHRMDWDTLLEVL